MIECGACRALSPLDFRYVLVTFPFISRWREDPRMRRQCWHCPAVMIIGWRWYWFWYPSDVGIDE